MEKSKDTKVGIACPFCGAPQRDIVTPNVAQLRCEYCGTIFPVSPHLRDIARCPNHPEIFATGLCNDCGENFCTRCLHIYNLKTQSDEATLYLCPECFSRRELEKADASIWFGALFIAIGFFVALINVLGGILLILFTSVPMILYGIYRRGSILTEKQRKDEERNVILKEENEVAELTQDVDTDALYSKMLAQYMMRWGVANAKELLDSEIRPYIRSGLTYDEAVCKVAKAKGIKVVKTRKENEQKSE